MATAPPTEAGAAPALAVRRPRTAVVMPTSLADAVAEVAARPEALVVAGGTDVMVDLNAGRRWPRALVCLNAVGEIRGVWPSDGEIVLGAGLTFADLMERRIAALLPAVAQAARTVGTPQVRSQATLGGNLATGAPDGDALPVLAALGAEVVCRDAEGWRQFPVLELYDRRGRSRLQPGELIVSVRVPVSSGIQGFLKVGVRGGAARTAVSVGLAVDPARQTATCTLGNVGPVARRIDHAGLWLAQRVDWEQGAIADPSTYETFARLVGDAIAATPEGQREEAGEHGARADWWVDADYRRRAVEVCARRALLRALPPSGWLEQVRAYQAKAEFKRYARSVAAAEAPVPPQEPGLRREPRETGPR